MLGLYNKRDKGAIKKSIGKIYLRHKKNFKKPDTKRARKISIFFLSETTWTGPEVNEQVVKRNKEEIKAILQLRPPKSFKELRSIIGAIQNAA